MKRKVRFIAAGASIIVIVAAISLFVLLSRPSIERVELTIRQGYGFTETPYETWIFDFENQTCTLIQGDFVENTVESEQQIAVSNATLKEVEKAINQNNFFDLPPDYSTNATDADLVYITVTAENMTHTTFGQVPDHVGFNRLAQELIRITKTLQGGVPRTV